MPDIVTVSGLVEPQRAYNFLVTILTAPPAVPIVDGLEFRAKSCSIPEQAFDRIEIPFRWMRWFVPGRESADKTVEIVWWEGEDGQVYEAMWAWREAVGSWQTGGQSLKSDISGDIEISLVDGNENVLRTFIIRNAFLATLNAVELSYEDSRVMEVRAVFQFDYMEMV